MKTIKAPKTFTLKDGGTIAQGDSLMFLRHGEVSSIGIFLHNGTERKLRYRNLIKVPGIKTMEKWCDAGIAKSVFGAKTEPDGYGPEVEPSWLLAEGMI